MTFFDIDIRAVLFFLFAGNIMAATLFSAYRWGTKDTKDVYDRLFLFGKVGQGVAWFLIFLRGSVPVAFSLAAGNIFLVAGQAAECLAMVSLTRLSGRLLPPLFGGLAALASAISISLVYPLGMEVRLALVSMVPVVLFFVTGSGFIFLPRNPSWLTRLLGAVYSFCAFGIFARALNFVRNNQVYSVFSPQNWQLIALILLILVMSIGNLGYILVKKDGTDRRLVRMATCDFLTGAYNRSAFYNESRCFWTLASRNGTSLSLLTIDLDNFKRVNDRFGHPVGDWVLREVVDVIRACLRSYDVLGRYGGDEFVVLLPETNQTEAAAVAERIRRAVCYRFSHSDRALKCTASIGVADCRPEEDGVTFEDLIRFSDDVLYEAKRTGKNRVVAFSNKIETLHGSIRTQRKSAVYGSVDG